MSEVAQGLLKTLTQLTTTKGAVKYISVVIALWILTKIDNLNIISLPTEYKTFATILLSLGFGSLLGELFYSICEKTNNSFREHMKEKNKSKKEKLNIDMIKADLHSRTNVLSVKEKEILLKIFTETSRTKKRQIYLERESTFMSINSSIANLAKFGFINIIEEIGYDKFHVEINKFVLNEIEEWANTCLEADVDDFISQMRSDDICVIKTLGKDTSMDERKSLLKNLKDRYKQFNITYKSPCILLTNAGSSYSFYISPLYKEIIEKKLNIELMQNIHGKWKDI